MKMLNGEVKQVGISVVSQFENDFIIASADYSITDNTGLIITSGSCTIDGHNIITLFSATSKGNFVCEFTYRIGPEILKARITVNVL